MNNSNTQGTNRDFLKAMLDFTSKNYVTANEVAGTLKTFIDVVNSRLNALDKKISQESGSLLQTANQSATSAIKSAETLLGNRVNARLKLLDTQVEEKFSELEQEFQIIVDDMAKQSTETLVQRASETAYNKIRPEIMTEIDAIVSAKNIDGKVKILEESLDERFKGIKKEVVHVHDGGGAGGFIETALKAGSNVSISKDVFGAWVITVSNAPVGIITVSGTIDDSNLTFTSTTEPQELIINGGTYQKTGGAITWSWVTGTITLSSPVGTNGSIYGHK